MIKRLGLIFVLSLIFQFSFSQNTNNNKDLFDNISAQNKVEINLLLSEFLDGAGLYTILGDLKPISTIQLNSLSDYYRKIPQSASEAEKYKDIINKKVKELMPLLAEMSNEHLYFRLLPIQTDLNIPNIDYKVTLMPEILILRKDLVYNTIQKYESFFRTININTQGDYISKIEDFLFENSDHYLEARARAFGYLFGYPKYAVDFFVNNLISESHTSDPETTLNDRNFHQIPTYGNLSKYSYAIPKDSKNREEDIELTIRAKNILDTYTEKRKLYMQGSNLNAIKLIQEWNR